MRRISNLLIISVSIFVVLESSAQGVAVNTTGDVPHESAMLDVQSTTQGMLIPRMTTAQREAILLPATGLLVYDTNKSSFWFRNASQWVELTDNFHGLVDADADTKIQVEESMDEDIIRFDIGGVQAMVISESTQGATRVDVSPDQSLIIGHQAGLTTYPGWNTFLGYQAGMNNTTGDRSVFIGHRAGQNNAAGQDRNIFIGYEAGINNGGGFNTMVGYQTGVINSTGHSNAFFGYIAGTQNTTGFRNTFVGSQAGHNNEITSENTLVGFSAGYNNEANQNTFVGINSGFANRTGTYNTIIGASAAGNQLSNQDLGNGNSIVGFQAGYWADGIVDNALIGYRAGYNMTTGKNNAFVGKEAGFATTTGISNVAIGIASLRSNVLGNRNVAIGDSTLFTNTVSGNVAIGSKAGRLNTTGTSNTFVGLGAGGRNTVGKENLAVGAGAGGFNLDGNYNVFLGPSAGAGNQDGDLNTFAGYSAGFRNNSGEQNVFLGDRAAEYNDDGSGNVAIGIRALSKNTNGGFNVAIGDHALGDPGGNATSIYRNIAIGQNAARNTTFSDNIVIGNESGLSLSGSNNVLLGNDIDGGGLNNTFIGSSTSTALPFIPENATAIGYNARIQQDNSIILGDALNDSTKVGIGTNTPDAWLQIEGHGLPVFKVTQNGTGAMYVSNSAQVLVEQELLVNTAIGKPGYHVSIDGKLACEEVLVQASGAWPDYVFQRDYNLMPYESLRDHLKTNHHLPGIPSAAEVEEDGIKLGDMQKQLLEKIEELTLYILELESRMQVLEKK